MRKLAKAIDLPFDQVQTWFATRRQLESMMVGKAVAQRESQELSKLFEQRQSPVVAVRSEGSSSVPPPAPASPISDVALASGNEVLEGKDLTSPFGSSDFDDAFDYLMSDCDMAHEMDVLMNAKTPLVLATPVGGP